MRNQTWPAISLLTRLEVEECMAKLEANMEEHCTTFHSAWELNCAGAVNETHYGGFIPFHV